METPHNIETEAAKFLEKLINESKDEPPKLASKLFAICQHMKASGKENSMPYQVISRAMQSVVHQHGLDMDALRSSRLASSSGIQSTEATAAMSNDRDQVDASRPSGSNDASLSFGAPFGSKQIEETGYKISQNRGQISNPYYVLPENHMPMHGAPTSLMQFGGPSRVDYSVQDQLAMIHREQHGSPASAATEDTKSINSQEFHESQNVDKVEAAKSSRSSKKTNAKRKRMDSTSKVGNLQSQNMLQSDIISSTVISSKRPKLSDAARQGQMEDMAGQNLMHHIHHPGQLSVFSTSKDSGIKVGTQFSGNMGFGAALIPSNQSGEAEMSAFRNISGLSQGGPLQFRPEAPNRGLWNQTKSYFPPGLPQGTKLPPNFLVASMTNDANVMTGKEMKHDQDCRFKGEQGVEYHGPRSLDYSVAQVDGFGNKGQDAFSRPSTSNLTENCMKSSSCVEPEKHRAMSLKDIEKPILPRGASRADAPFKEHHLRQLRAQCLVFLAFRNGLVPRKLHLEIALGEKVPTEVKDSGKDPNHDMEGNDKEVQNDATMSRSFPGSSSSGGNMETNSASKEAQFVRVLQGQICTPDLLSPSTKMNSEPVNQIMGSCESSLAVSLPVGFDTRKQDIRSISDDCNKKAHDFENSQAGNFLSHLSVSLEQKQAVGPWPSQPFGQTTSTMPPHSVASGFTQPLQDERQVSIAGLDVPSQTSSVHTAVSGPDPPLSTLSRDQLSESKMSINCESPKQMIVPTDGVSMVPENGTAAATDACNIATKRLSEEEKLENIHQDSNLKVSVTVNNPQINGQSLDGGQTCPEKQESENQEDDEEDDYQDDTSLEDLAFSAPKHGLLEKLLIDHRKKKLLEDKSWAVKQRKAEEKIKTCSENLKEKVSSSSSGDISAKTKSVIELKKLQLLQLQRRLRSEFLHDVFRPITSDIDRLRSIKKNRQGRRVKQLEKYEVKMREERQKRIRERQKEFFGEIEFLRERLEETYKVKRECVKAFNKSVKEFHKRKERIYREKIDRIQREKINLLKANDVEGYLRMVQDAKSDRVKQLLKETEKYLQKLSSKLQEAKAMARHFEMETEDTHSGNGIDKSDVHVVNEDDRDQAQHYLESNEKYYKMAHSIKESILDQPSILQGGKLREYQMNGLRWLVSLYNNNLNGILADEMGLGKTVQVISLICYLMESKNDRGPFLIVVPSSVLPGWASEINNWAPTINKIVYAGPPEERRKLFKERIIHQKFNVLLTTYEYLMNKHDRPKLSKINWHYVIIDEGHRIKNASCKLNSELKHYQSSHRLLLTGTPLQNNLEELWALLNFLLPNIFNSAEDFSQWFNKPFESGSDSSPDEALLSEEENLLIINRLHQVLRPFVLRRLKHKVENELPEKIERLVRCEASAYQKLLMKRVEENLGSIGNVKARAVHNTVMELRNICNHPYISQLHVEEVDTMIPKHFLPSLVRHCGKLEMLDRILPKLKATGHRVLLFSTMTRLLDVMEDYLCWKGYGYLRLDGHTSGNERGALIEEFNKEGSKAFIFLLSIRAGGVGVNLQAADTVVIFDTDWNPQVDLQAQARAHRIGQKKDVLVLRLETVRTVEEQVRAAAEHKLGVANQSITAGFFDNHTSAEDRREYLEGLLRESKKEEAAPVLDDDALNYLLARSESEIDVFESLDKKRYEDEMGAWLKLLQSQGKDGAELVQMPSRLVSEEDLKPFYEAMHIHETAGVKSKDEHGSSDVQKYGRGKRARDVRSYEEQLTEEEFEKLCQVDSPGSPLSPAQDFMKMKDTTAAIRRESSEEPPTSKRGRGRPKRPADMTQATLDILPAVVLAADFQKDIPPGFGVTSGTAPHIPTPVLAGEQQPVPDTSSQGVIKQAEFPSISPTGEVNRTTGVQKEGSVPPEKAPRLLVSQEREWLNKPSKTPSAPAGSIALNVGTETKKVDDLILGRISNVKQTMDQSILDLSKQATRGTMKDPIPSSVASASKLKQPDNNEQLYENYAHLIDINKSAAAKKGGENELGQVSVVGTSGKSSYAQSQMLPLASAVVDQGTKVSSRTVAAFPMANALVATITSSSTTATAKPAENVKRKGRPRKTTQPSPGEVKNIFSPHPLAVPHKLPSAVAEVPPVSAATKNFLGDKSSMKPVHAVEKKNELSAPDSLQPAKLPVALFESQGLTHALGSHTAGSSIYISTGRSALPVGFKSTEAIQKPKQGVSRKTQHPQPLDVKSVASSYIVASPQEKFSSSLVGSVDPTQVGKKSFAEVPDYVKPVELVGRQISSNSGKQSTYSQDAKKHASSSVLSCPPDLLPYETKGKSTNTMGTQLGTYPVASPATDKGSISTEAQVKQKAPAEPKVRNTGRKQKSVTRYPVSHPNLLVTAVNNPCPPVATAVEDTQSKERNDSSLAVDVKDVNANQVSEFSPSVPAVLENQLKESNMSSQPSGPVAVVLDRQQKDKEITSATVEFNSLTAESSLQTANNPPVLNDTMPAPLSDSQVSDGSGLLERHPPDGDSASLPSSATTLVPAVDKKRKRVPDDAPIFFSSSGPSQVPEVDKRSEKVANEASVAIFLPAAPEAPKVATESQKVSQAPSSSLLIAARSEETKVQSGVLDSLSLLPETEIKADPAHEENVKPITATNMKNQELDKAVQSHFPSESSIVRDCLDGGGNSTDNETNVGSDELSAAINNRTGEPPACSDEIQATISDVPLIEDVRSSLEEKPNSPEVEDRIFVKEHVREVRASVEESVSDREHENRVCKEAVPLVSSSAPDKAVLVSEDLRPEDIQDIRAVRDFSGTACLSDNRTGEKSGDDVPKVHSPANGSDSSPCSHSGTIKELPEVTVQHNDFEPSKSSSLDKNVISGGSDPSCTGSPAEEKNLEIEVLNPDMSSEVPKTSEDGQNARTVQESKSCEVAFHIPTSEQNQGSADMILNISATADPPTEICSMEIDLKNTKENLEGHPAAEEGSLLSNDLPNSRLDKAQPTGNVGDLSITSTEVEVSSEIVVAPVEEVSNSHSVEESKSSDQDVPRSCEITDEKSTGKAEGDDDPSIDTRYQTNCGSQEVAVASANDNALKNSDNEEDRSHAEAEGVSITVKNDSELGSSGDQPSQVGNLEDAETRLSSVSEINNLDSLKDVAMLDCADNEDVVTATKSESADLVVKDDQKPVSLDGAVSQEDTNDKLSSGIGASAAETTDTEPLKDSNAISNTNDKEEGSHISVDQDASVSNDGEEKVGELPVSGAHEEASAACVPEERGEEGDHSHLENPCFLVPYADSDEDMKQKKES